MVHFDNSYNFNLFSKLLSYMAESALTKGRKETKEQKLSSI